jgi:SNF2 family DNA or RNA helicase
LGKTCTVIGFLCHLFDLDDTAKHLIVVPSSVLDNWMVEFGRFAPQLSVAAYTGSQEERSMFQQDVKDGHVSFKILVTSYATLQNKSDLKFLRRTKFSSNIMDEGENYYFLTL